MSFGKVAVQIRDNGSTENLTKLLWNNTHNFYEAHKNISQGPHHTMNKTDREDEEDTKTEQRTEQTVRWIDWSYIV